MNIAMLFSGHFRTAQNTSKLLLQSFPENINIFCHCWKNISHTDHVWWSKNGDGENALKQIEEQELINLYNPKKILIEEQKTFRSKNKFYNEIGGYQAVCSQWYSVFQSFNLMKQFEIENNMKFDIIIKNRYDLGYINKINIEELNDIYKNKNIIYFLPTPHSIDSGIFSDILFFTSRGIFEKIIKFNDELEQYFDEAIKWHKIIEGERPFTAYIRKKNNFNCQIKYSNLKCYIERMNGDKIKIFK
jgi:hypothetical protein